MRPNAIKIIAMQRTTVRTNVVQRFVCSHEWCTIFKGRKTSRSCLCVCCATMRLLLNMLHVIVQRFTIIARFISFHIESFRPISYKCYLTEEDFLLLLCESYQINVINFYMFYFEKKKLRMFNWELFIFFNKVFLTRKSAELCANILKSINNYIKIIFVRTIERKIVRAPHVQSQWRTFSRTITWSLARSYRIILQHSLSLYNSRI